MCTTGVITVPRSSATVGEANDRLGGDWFFWNWGSEKDKRKRERKERSEEKSQQVSWQVEERLRGCARCGWGWVGGERGESGDLGSSRAAPAARHVITPLRQASRVRPLLQGPLPSPNLQLLIGPLLAVLQAALFETRSPLPRRRSFTVVHRFLFPGAKPQNQEIFKQDPFYSSLFWTQKTISILLKEILFEKCRVSISVKKMKRDSFSESSIVLLFPWLEYRG